MRILKITVSWVVSPLIMVGVLAGIAALALECGWRSGRYLFIGDDAW